MRKIPPHKKIHSDRIYSPETLADEIGFCIRTIYRHLKAGLPVDKNVRPYLIHGREAKKYFHEKYESRKRILEENQFYCMTCKKAVSVDLQTAKKVYSGGYYSKNNAQIILKTTCPNCGKRVNKFPPRTTLARVNTVATIPSKMFTTTKGEKKWK